jgi:cytochrome c biogenesis protein CcdA
MKYLKKLKLGVFLFLLLFFVQKSWAVKQIEVYFFESGHCKVCLNVKNEFLPKVVEKFGESVIWKHYDVSEHKEYLQLLYALTEKYHKNKTLIPTAFVGDTLLVGRSEITQNLEQAIEFSLVSDKKTETIEGERLTSKIKNLSVLAIITSGLIDGINPCAFAVIVFFISFLSVYGYKKRELFYIGLAYCLAVFLTYLLIGFGFFKILYSLKGFYGVMKVFYYLIAGFCFALFAFSVYDFIVYKKTGKSEGLILQLPKFLKLRINRIIGDKLRNSRGSGLLKLFFASLVIGFLVSIVEAVCTGQVYLPTIIFIMKEGALRVKALVYLLLYNLMFIMPLIMVFILALAGYNSDKFNSFLKKHLALMKILIALVFLGLGLLLAFNI